MKKLLLAAAVLFSAESFAQKKICFYTNQLSGKKQESVSFLIDSGKVKKVFTTNGSRKRDEEKILPYDKLKECSFFTIESGSLMGAHQYFFLKGDTLIWYVPKYAWYKLFLPSSDYPFDMKIEEKIGIEPVKKEDSQAIMKEYL